MTYREDVDIQPDEFYRLLAEADGLPTTCQPSAGDIAELYRKLAEVDDQIFSIHMSSGMSGTFESAKAGAQMVPETSVHFYDTRTLPAAAGWQVEAAVRVIKDGWTVDDAASLMKQIGDASESIYTLNELKYLIHGGRMSHLKGLLASVLNVKTLIGIEKVGGIYVQLGQVRSFKKALQGLVDLILAHHPAGSELRVQVLHSNNPEGAEALQEMVDEQFDRQCRPLGQMSLVFGAYAGPSMVGVAYAD